MPKYNHNKNILTEKAGRKNQIEPGHIVRFNYGGKKVTTKRPLVLVLHPKYKGQMHALKLDNIAESVLNQLWRLTKLELQGKIQKLVKLRLPLLKPDIGNPKAFYRSRLKKFLKGKLGSTGEAYRTYSVGAISSLRIIDYRFEGSSFADEVRDEAEELKNK